MAYIEPKTNWIASNIPVASDFSRIEGNTKQNHDDIAAEAIARAADVDAEEAARIADVNAEESARIAADLLKLETGNLGSRQYSSVFVPTGGSTILPFGTYYIKYSFGPVQEIKDSTGTWHEFPLDGLVISDGINIKITNQSSSTGLWIYLFRIL